MNPTKRTYDIIISFIGLILLAPVFLLLALCVKLGSKGPIFFKQQRVGQNEKLFRLYKFRTMVVNAEKQGASITADGDRRITKVGRFLRKTKLDELPQLWNVFIGDMSLVGPRPEVPEYVNLYPEGYRKVLEFRPGITDLATLTFYEEERILSQADDPEKFYVEHIMPRKIKLNLEFARDDSLFKETRLILKTILAIVKVQTHSDRPWPAESLQIVADNHSTSPAPFNAPPQRKGA